MALFDKLWLLPKLCLLCTLDERLLQSQDNQTRSAERGLALTRSISAEGTVDAQRYAQKPSTFGYQCQAREIEHKADVSTHRDCLMVPAKTMALNNANEGGEREPTEFELRRAELVGQIGDSLEQVLTQINALNRSLEGIIEIGNEFASVEALWSQFETVMAHGQTNEEKSSPKEPTSNERNGNDDQN